MKSSMSGETLSAFDWARGFALVFVWAVIAGSSTMVVGADEKTSSVVSSQLAVPTHQQTRMIRPKIDGEEVTLHTMTTTTDGQILAAVGGYSPSVEMTPQGMKMKVVKQPAAVLLISKDGKTQKRWDLDITPTGLAVSKSGKIFAAGSGKILQLAGDGTVAASTISPHMGDRTPKTRPDGKPTGAAPEADEQLKTLQSKIDAIEEKDADDRTRLEEVQLKAFSRQVDMLKQLLGVSDEQETDGEPMPSSIQLRREQVTSLAASDENVFVCATDPNGGGYSIWRIDGDLKPDSAEIILDGLRGCCGQMDIQCCGEKLLVSENTKFKVGIYDHFGRRQGSFGKRDRTSRDGFGSCCNPMNSFGMPDGTILTAESSIGHIKRFDTEGNLVAYIGKASIGGGCKHCSLGHDAENDIYYMMYEDKNAICVMEKSDGTAVSAAAEQLALRSDKLLPLISGSWAQIKSDGEEEKKPESGPFGLLGGSSLPITAMTISKDGSAKIDSGFYQNMAGDTQIELLPPDPDSPDNSYNIGLVNDQVRMIESVWTFEDVDHATVDFGRGMVLKMKRESPTPEGVSTKIALDLVAVNTEGAAACPEGCDGKNCGNAACAKSATTPPSELVAQQVANSIGVGSVAPRAQSFAIPVEMPSVRQPSSKVEYKMIGKKKLGLNPEMKLNQLGRDGWDYCGMLGGKLLFKRYATASTKAQVEQVADRTSSER